MEGTTIARRGGGSVFGVNGGVSASISGTRNADIGGGERAVRWAALSVILLGVLLIATQFFSQQHTEGGLGSLSDLVSPVPILRSRAAVRTACSKRNATSSTSPATVFAFFLPLSHFPVPVHAANVHSVGELARAAVNELALAAKLGHAVTAADVRLFVISREAALRISRDNALASGFEKGLPLHALDSFDAAELCEGSCLLLELAEPTAPKTRNFSIAPSPPCPSPVRSIPANTPKEYVQGPAVSAPVWTDEQLYTSEGQRHDSWRLLPRSQIAPLTAEAQEVLIARQFPTGGCVGAKFLVSHGNKGHGLGSILHVATSHLSAAIETGRIFVWNENAGDSYIDNDTCPGSVNLECFFRAPSSCTIKDARAPGADTVDFEVYNAAERLGLSAYHVPAVMRNLWISGDRSTSRFVRPAPHAMELKYWWRAQAVSFLARLNDATIVSIRELRRNSSAVIMSSGAGAAPLHQSNSVVGPGWPPGRDIDVAAGALMAAAFPFMRGMTSIHVRHGDKHHEMTLVPDESYFAAAESLVMHHPMGLARAAFISTEDPGTLAAAMRERRGWASIWYDMPRISTVAVNPGLQDLPLPRAQLTRILLMQLLMTLECDAWIGTRGSNWNRFVYSVPS